MRDTLRRSFAAALVLACAAVLPACAPDPAAQAAAQEAAAVAELDRITQTRNDADVAFVQAMLPHHEQGVELADLVTARTDTLPVRDMAFRITRAQGFEVGQLRGHLVAWRLPADGMAAMAGMPGMVDPRGMAALRDARGAAFDRLWLQAMITHHEGAVTMAETELAGGVHRGARNMATNVIAVQRAEIATMRALQAG